MSTNRLEGMRSHAEETDRPMAMPYGITADLADRMHVERVGQQLADEHADAALLVNAAGFSSASPSWTTTAPPMTPTWSWTGRSSS
jgi:short-subunit dehydrogenase